MQKTSVGPVKQEYFSILISGGLVGLSVGRDERKEEICLFRNFVSLTQGPSVIDLQAWEILSHARLKMKNTRKTESHWRHLPSRTLAYLLEEKRTLIIQGLGIRKLQYALKEKKTEGH